ncbi:unnamed protein product [Calicophoron daubneyi]|uniref:alpha-1,2-Mannosidase n=1 Tax=Calicophoron daubneyi TaxID=300641 RepID=A0AAV2SZ39_CALDB
MRFSSVHCSRGRRWKSIVIQFSIIVLILNFTWWSMLNLLQDDGGKLVLKVTIIDPYLELASEVREATLDSWNAYKEHAWGLDELRPISQTGRIWMGTALTMVDSLDTLWIMNLRHEFAKARQWITEKLKFDLNDDHINVFEITIRVLGGLLSAYSLSEERVFLEKAETLGSKLQATFDSQSVLPNVNINLALQVSGPAPWTNDQSLAEVSSLQLELNQLTAVTGNITYALKGGKILKHLHTVKKHRGLLNTEFSTKTGEPREYSRITMGARGDSYYEYLLKVWIQNGKTADFLKQDYIAAVDGIKELLVGYSQPSGFLFVGELNGSKKRIPSMEHLVCFLPGTLAYGVYHGMPADHLQIAEGLMRTCYEMYRQMPKHLSPERVIFSEAPDSKLDIQTTFDRVGSNAHLLLHSY